MLFPSVFHHLKEFLIGIPGGRFTARDLLPPSATRSCFPSTGLGGPRRPNSGLGASAGVALANRGDA
jgi:hypothetical protein